jgi:hypothetical protein
MSDQYPTGTYVKGDSVRICRTSAAAVAAVYEGFSLAKTDSKVEAGSVAAPVTDDVRLDGPSYKELQVLAKEAGIPANQSEADLRAALESATSTSTPADNES